jgi:molybdate transport system substrate-binding protein
MRSSMRALRMAGRAALLAGAGLAVAAAAHSGGLPGSTLHVFAATSLGETFSDLAAAFEKAHPGTSVELNLAGSQQLAAQIQQGAPADVFAADHRRWIDDTRAAGLLAGDPQLFARNVLVGVTPRMNPGNVYQFQDLGRSGVRVAIGAEDSPVGAYSRWMLANLTGQPGFGGDYEDRVLANVVWLEENAKSVLARVSDAQADAGIVYRSDVTPVQERFVRTVEVPQAGNVIAEYRIAAVSKSPQAWLARAFVELVLSPGGQAVLERHRLIRGGNPIP